MVAQASVPIQEFAVCKQLKVPALVVVNESDPVHPGAGGAHHQLLFPGRTARRSAFALDGQLLEEDVVGALRHVARGEYTRVDERA